jgi:hypothetical protein
MEDVHALFATDWLLIATFEVPDYDETRIGDSWFESKSLCLDGFGMVCVPIGRHSYTYQVYGNQVVGSRCFAKCGACMYVSDCTWSWFLYPSTFTARSETPWAWLVCPLAVYLPKIHTVAVIESQVRPWHCGVAKHEPILSFCRLSMG